MKNVSFTTIVSTKGSELTRMNLCSLPQKWSFMEEKSCCVYGGTIVVLFISSSLTTIKYSMQTYTLNSVHENKGKRPALVFWRNVVLLHDNERLHSPRITLEKILDLG